jgi:hypothetical protein
MTILKPGTSWADAYASGSPATSRTTHSTLLDHPFRAGGGTAPGQGLVV